MASITAWDLSLGWPVPGLAQNVRALMKEREAELLGGTLRYSLLRGLLVSDARIKVRLQAGHALLASPSTIVGLDRLKLLRGVTWCDDLRIERATISLFLSHQARKTAQEPPDYPDYIPRRRRGPRFAPSRLRIEDADISVHSPDGDPILSMSAASLTIEKPQLSTFVDNPLEALYGSGTLRAGRLTRSGVTHTNLVGDLDIGGGKLNFASLDFAGSEGSFHLTGVKVNLTSWPPLVRADLDANLHDMRYVLYRIGLPVFGPLGGRLRARIEGPLTAPRVQGGLSLAAGREMSGVPFLQEASNLLLPSGHRQTAREAWEVPFTLQDSSLTIDDAHLRTDAMDFRITGAIRAGACSFAVDVLLPEKEIAHALPPAVVADLSAGDGLVRIPFEVTGTPRAPRFDVRPLAVSPSTYSELRSYLRANAAANRLSTALLQ